MADLTLGVTLVELEAGCCKWPIGVDADDVALFCGAERRQGSPSYCDQHHRLAYLPKQQPTTRRCPVCRPIRLIQRVDLARVIWRQPVL